MPGLPKDRPAGRLGRLISALRPARAGPLPVQTGFPTSLADLFVKNHGRLRKPSSASRRKKRGAPPLPTPPPSPPPASPPPSPPAAASPPAQPTPDLPPAEPVSPTGGGGGGSAFGLGLGFLALVGVVSLALLVIWSRKVVAAVTVAAFLLVLLESARSFSLPRSPRAPAIKEGPDSGGRGYVSPIREAEPEPEPPGRSCSDLGRGTDAVPVLPAEVTVEERGEAGDDGSNPKAKSKRRSWRKLIPRKLQRGGRVRGEAESPSVSSFRSEGSDADAAALAGGNAGASDLPGSRRGSGSGRRHQADAFPDSSDSSAPRHGIGTDGAEARGGDGGGAVEADASADLAGVDGVGGGGRRIPFVAAVVVVLVGLVGGRLPAVAVTVLCSAAVSSLQRLSAGLKRGA